MWLKSFLENVLILESNPDDFLKNCEKGKLILAIDACLCIIKVLHDGKLTLVPSLGVSAEFDGGALNVLLNEDTLFKNIKDFEKTKFRLWKTVQHSLGLLNRFTSVDFSQSFALNPNLNLIHTIIALCQNIYRTRMIISSIPHERISGSCCCSLHDSVIRCLKSLSSITFETLFFPGSLSREEYSSQIKLLHRYRKIVLVERLSMNTVRSILNLSSEVASSSHDSHGQILPILSSLLVRNYDFVAKDQKFLLVLGFIAEYAARKRNHSHMTHCLRLALTTLRSSDKNYHNLRQLISSFTSDVSWISSSDIRALCTIFKKSVNGFDSVFPFIAKIFGMTELSETRPDLIEVIRSHPILFSEFLPDTLWVLSEDNDMESAYSLVSIFASYHMLIFMPWFESNYEKILSTDAGYGIAAIILGQHVLSELIIREIKTKLASVDPSAGCCPNRCFKIMCANALLLLPDAADVISLYHTTLSPPFEGRELNLWLDGILTIAGLSWLPDVLINTIESLFAETNTDRNSLNHEWKKFKTIQENIGECAAPRLAGFLVAINRRVCLKRPSYDFLESFTFFAGLFGRNFVEKSCRDEFMAAIDTFWSLDWDFPATRDFLMASYTISSFYGPGRPQSFAPAEYFQSKYSNSENRLLEILPGNTISVSTALLSQFGVFAHVLDTDDDYDCVIRFPKGLLNDSDKILLEAVLQKQNLRNLSFDKLSQILRIAIFLQNQELLNTAKDQILESIASMFTCDEFCKAESRLLIRCEYSWDFLFGLVKLPPMFLNIVPELYEYALALFYHNLFLFCRSKLFQEDIRKLSPEDVEFIRMKRIDLFGSSGDDEESFNRKPADIMMFAEAKRQKLKNLEGLAKELPAELVTTKARSSTLTPINIDSDDPSILSEHSEIQSEIEDNTKLYGSFDEAEDISEPLDEDHAFIIDFGNRLRRLDSSRASIDDAMSFALDHFDRADTASMMLLRSMQSKNVDFPRIVARLYLVSDILYNSFSVYSKAEPLRHAIEKTISDMIEVFVDLFNSVSSRMKAESIRKTVVALIDLWEKWTVLPKLLCQNLRFMFTAAYRDEVMVPLVDDRLDELEDINGKFIEFSTYWNLQLKDDIIDGSEIQF